MTYIHYGHTEFRGKDFRQIKNEAHWNKPRITGLWASPVDSEYGWKDWCEDEKFGVCRVANSFTFQLSENAKVYVIDSVDDLINVPHKITYSPEFLLRTQFIDFEKMSIDYDAIYLTWNGQCETRFSKPMDLYGWDCECILIMNPDVVEVLHYSSLH